MNVIKLKQHNAGVALIQVLFIASILSLMALHFTLTSRQQVTIAASLQDKVQAELQLLDWKNELLFTLLTQPATGTIGADTIAAESIQQNRISQHWNFHGNTFSPVDNVQIRLQDIEGLISISTAGRQAELQKLLRYLQLPEAASARIISELAAQQDLPSTFYLSNQLGRGREMFLQSLSELQQFPELNAGNYQALAGLTTNLQLVRFNPLHAPDGVLRALLLPEIANEVIRLRNAKALTAAGYIALVSQYDDERYSFVRSQRLIIELEVSHGSAVAKQRFICYIRPQSKFPLIWLD